MISTVTWTPKAVNQADSIALVTLAKGAVITDAWLWVEQASDNGSSGQMGLSGDTFNLLLLANAVSGDLYSDVLGRVIYLLNNNHAQVATAAETVRLTWTPGGNPGATIPRVTIKITTEQLF